MSFALMSAPFATRVCMTFKLPRKQAMCSGVRKLFVLASTYAPAFIRTSIILA